jgi:hypothetical protein
LQTENKEPSVFSNVIPAVGLDSRDSFFIDDISGKTGCWWHGSEPASFDTLNELFWKRMEAVSEMLIHISSG